MVSSQNLCVLYVTGRQRYFSFVVSLHSFAHFVLIHFFMCSFVTPCAQVPAVFLVLCYILTVDCHRVVIKVINKKAGRGWRLSHYSS